MITTLLTPMSTGDAAALAVSDLMGGRTSLIATLSGSALYGTGGASSDQDIRCAFIPLKREILTGRVTFGIDSNLENKRLGMGDVDVAGVSVMRYLGLIGRMDMITSEQLFASISPRYRVSDMHPVFARIWESRDKLLAGNASSATGHARQRMGAFFPDGDESLDGAREAHAIVSTLTVDRIIDAPGVIARLAAIPGVKVQVQGKDRFNPGRDWEDMTPEEQETGWADGKPVFIIVCGKKMIATSPMDIVLRILSKPLETAAQIKRITTHGDDVVWKDAYQGVRLIYQAIELHVSRCLTFPRPEAPFLKQIRAGEISVDALKDNIAEKMDELRVVEAQFPFRAEPCKATTLDIVCDAHEMVVRS